MEVLQAISGRRSHRAYRKDQLSEETLSEILKAGLEAPSARNRQPWHFSVVQNADLIQEVQKGLFYDDGTGYIELGRDDTYFYDDERNLLTKNKKKASKTHFKLNKNIIKKY